MILEKSCGAIVYRRHHGNLEILLIKHVNSGHWSFPKGHVEEGETEVETATREIKEETGIEVKEFTYLFSIPNIYRYSGIDIHTLDMFFLCHVPAGTEAVAADDASECFWMPVDDIHTEQFGLRSVRQALYQAEFLKKQK